jgi:Protein of unknown function (DUF3426)
VVFRSQLLVAAPELRPALTTLCTPWRCTVNWPARADLLAVIGSEMQALPGTNVLELTAVVRNRANHPQPLPAVEVTLTDTSNRAVIRKVLTAADYLAGSSDAARRIAEGLEAGGEVTIRVAFEATGGNATGYGFLVYPFHL